MTLSFNISDDAYKLLLSMKGNRIAEYRDARYETLEDFLKDNKEGNNSNIIQRFLNRNHNGTLYLINELLKYGLVENDFDAWHTTYILSDFGKEMISEQRIRDNKLIEILK